MSVLPMRPPMPTAEDELRSKHQAARWQILEEDHQQIAEDWRDEHVAPEAAEAWGPSDLAVNPLAEIATQLSTPGLYGSQPVMHHADPAAEALFGPQGAFAGMGYWTKMQRVEYYARGMSDMLVRFEVVPNPTQVVARLVRPSDIWVKPNRYRQDEAEVIAELRLMYFEAEKRHLYVWEVHDLGDEEVGRPPSHRIVAAKGDGGFGDDMSNVFLRGPDGKFGALVGDAYPLRYADGQPFHPYVCYRLADSGRFWNHGLMRGLHRGTLNAILYASYAGHCARAASGSSVIISGLTPPAGLDRETSNGTVLRRQTLLPGTAVYHQPDEASNGQAMVVEVGPGANLPDVAGFAASYAMQLAVRAGLNPADIQRQAANPTSGAALYISNKGKREASKRIEPLFRRTDLQAVRKVAALLRIAEIVPNVPETGYSVTYHHPPESPEEERDRRDRIDWEVERGYLSPIQAYQQLHPGTTREAALEAIATSMADKALIDHRAKSLTTTPTPAEPAPAGAPE